MPGTRSSCSDKSEGNELAELPSQRLPDEEAQIGGRRDTNRQANIELGMNNVEHDSLNEIDPDESARLWADLKAETGYDSYVDYLESYYGDYPYADMIKECFGGAWGYFTDLMNIPSLNRQTCAIFNLQDGLSSCPSLNLQYSSTSATTILSALRQPSSTEEVRIVLWEAKMLGVAMLNALGLGLKIHPEFFRALLMRDLPPNAFDMLPEKAFLRSREFIDGYDERRIVPEVVRLGQYLVTTARHYLSANLDASPVIVIFRLDEPPLPKPEKKAKNKLSRVSSSRESVPSAVSHSIKLLPPWMQEYVRELKHDLENRRGRSSSITDLLFKTLSPLLQFYVFRLREECDLARSEYIAFTLPQNKFQYESEILKWGPRRIGRGKIKGLRELFEMRYFLRRLVEDSEQHCQRLRRFIRSQRAPDAPPNESSTLIEDEVQQAHLEAHRLETELRDYLQLQTGELALQESRTSIELSSSQIEEAKRG